MTDESFVCHVNSMQLAKWINDNRPHVTTLHINNSVAVTVFKLKLDDKFHLAGDTFRELRIMKSYCHIHSEEENKN